VIVEDNVCAFPAIAACDRPWVRIMSCNPLELRDPALPPPFSGLPTGDPAGWAGFEAEYARRVGPLQRDFSQWCEQRGTGPLHGIDMIHESSWLNLSLYPDELDYPRRRLPAPTWHNLQCSVRTTDEPWTAPERDGRALVYLSLGSLGSADVGLMRELVALLADNMLGAEFLPQTSVLPHVDAVITHGGNNTVTECLWFGVPMVVLPIFWDQHDNAQRIHERGWGIRLNTYALTREALTSALEHVLGDAQLRERAATAGRRLRGRPGTVLAADLIERVACTGEPVIG
jgi:UDP:flavonoid glycosyltransferase YjiC (YdhE family)